MTEGQKWIDIPIGTVSKIAEDFNVSQRYVQLACDYNRNGLKAKMLRQAALHRLGEIFFASPSFIKIEKNLSEDGQVDSIKFVIGENEFVVFPDYGTAIMLACQLHTMYLESLDAVKKE